MLICTSWFFRLRPWVYLCFFPNPAHLFSLYHGGSGSFLSGVQLASVIRWAALEGLLFGIRYSFGFLARWLNLWRLVLLRESVLKDFYQGIEFKIWKVQVTAKEIYDLFVDFDSQIESIQIFVCKQCFVHDINSFVHLSLTLIL